MVVRGSRVEVAVEAVVDLAAIKAEARGLGDDLGEGTVESRSSSCRAWSGRSATNEPLPCRVAMRPARSSSS